MAFAYVFRQERDESIVHCRRSGPLQQFVRRPACQNTASIHRDQPIEAGRFFHIRGRDDDAHARPLGTDLVDQIPELTPGQRINARRGFVEDQQVGVVDQCAAKAQLLLHAARKLSGRPVDEGAHPGALQQFGDPFLALLLAMAKQPAEEVDILEHRQGRIQVLAQALRHIGDARADIVAMVGIRHIAAQRLDPALLNGARAGDQREQAGFADSVRADQPDHAA